MSEFSKDELSPPSWLDKAFFERVLRSSEETPSLEVTSFVVSPGTKPGEHYGSVMFKVSVDFCSQKPEKSSTRKLILKTFPQEDGNKANYLKNSPAFGTEAKFYSTVLPRMRVAQGEFPLPFPQLVYQDMTAEPSPVIVLEDLSPRDFKTYDDVIGNWDQLKLVVSRVAQFHALSMFVNDNGLSLSEFTEHYWLEGLEIESSLMAQFLKPTFNCLMESMKSWPEFQSYFSRLEGKIDLHCQKVVELLRSRGSGLKVLNHGDLDIKNFLKRGDGVEDEDLILIDFQYVCWATPALDFAYLFNQVSDDRLVESHRDEIVELYQKELQQALARTKFEGKIPTLEDVRQTLLEGRSLDLLYVMYTTPPRVYDWRDVDFDDMQDASEDEYKTMMQRVYRNPEYRKFLLEQFQRLEGTGVFDL